MDFTDLGFAAITLEDEKNMDQQYHYEYMLLIQRIQMGQITREEWFELLMELNKKYNLTINPRLLTIPWVSRHLENKTIGFVE